MQGAATQAMSFISEERQRSLSRRLSQMPARRRAPKGCRLPTIKFHMLLISLSRRLGSRQQNVKLLLREPLVLWFINTVTYSAPQGRGESSRRQAARF